MRASLLVLVVVLAMPSLAQAQSGGEQRIVLAPLSSLSGESSRELASVEKVVEAGLAAVPGVTLISARDANQAARKAKKPELRSCEGEVPCLSALGTLVGAEYAVYAEVGGLGGAQVIYLKIVDARSSKELRSTTLELADGQDQASDSLAAATRLISPHRYVGFLEFKTSVPGATVFLDGHKIATTPSAPISIYVGSHALRVTHPERSDYVRWVDIDFQKTTSIEADLQLLPELKKNLSIEGVLANPQDNTTVKYRPTPWYYRWYTIGGGTAALLVGSAVLFSSFGDEVNADLTKHL